jgi:8-oxo-dGTP diphosphatase
MEIKSPKVAASLAYYCQKNNSFLLVERLFEPFKNFYAFPGGYLEFGSEDLKETAIREFWEETGVKVDKNKIILIDDRSSPSRDPRGHTIDIGYLYVSEIIPNISYETNETRPKWFHYDEIKKLKLAFDHEEFFFNVMRELNL